jgi:hypothetical protein
MDPADGEVLIDMRERGHARRLLSLCVAPAVVGVAGALFGSYVLPSIVLTVPVLIWFARRAKNQGLLITTSGVERRRGGGSSVRFVPWSALRRVDLVLEATEWEHGKKWSSLLVFEHGELDRLRYRFPSPPSPDALHAIASVCREHGVAVGSDLTRAGTAPPPSP